MLTIKIVTESTGEISASVKLVLGSWFASDKLLSSFAGFIAVRILGMIQVILSKYRWQLADADFTECTNMTKFTRDLGWSAVACGRDRMVRGFLSCSCLRFLLWLFFWSDDHSCCAILRKSSFPFYLPHVRENCVVAQVSTKIFISNISCTILFGVAI